MLTDYCKIREHSPLALVHFIMIITKNVPRPICFRFCISLMHIMHITHMLLVGIQLKYKYEMFKILCAYIEAHSQVGYQ